jgi:hypothetical protein
MVPFAATFPKLNKLPRGWTGAHNGIISTFARKASSPKIQPTIIHTIQELKPMWMLRDRGGEGVFGGRHDSDKVRPVESAHSTFLTSGSKRHRVKPRRAGCPRKQNRLPKPPQEIPWPVLTTLMCWIAGFVLGGLSSHRPILIWLSRLFLLYKSMYVRVNSNT